MNFEDEEYVRLYCKDTITTNKIGWEGRLVLWEIMRKVDCAGVLDLEEGDDPAESIAALVKVPEEIVRIGLSALESRSVVRRTGTSIVIAKFVEAQNARRSDRLRAQEYRDRKKLGLAETREESAHESRGVTESNETSLPALPCPPLPCQEQTLVEPTLDAGVDSDKLDKAKARREKLNSDIKLVFQAWKEDTGHTNAKLDNNRSTRISARLTQGFTVDQLIRAIKNRKNDPWLMGITSDRKYDEIKTLLRDAAQVERLMALDFSRPGLPGAPKRDNFKRDANGRIQI